jgi:anti-anti-sigma factor
MMTTPLSANYEIVQVGDVDVVRLTQPKLDFPALEELQNELDRRIDEGCRKMLINLEPLTFVDSFGVGIIAEATRRMELAGGELKLCGVGDRVMMSLTITRLDQRLAIHADEPSALEAFGG